jgi:hypothetical protein
MNDIVKRNCDEALNFIYIGDFKEAHTIYSSMGDSKEPSFLKLSYLLSSTLNSPYYNAAASRVTLDSLCFSMDRWGLSEKGRCLLVGVLYDKNINEAEDFFYKSESEIKSKYYLAVIYAEGLISHDGAKGLVDISEALGLFDEVRRLDGPYKSLANMAYCKLLLGKSNLTLEENAALVVTLKTLIEEGQKGAALLWAKWLVGEIDGLIELGSTRKLSPGSMMERRNAETSSELAKRSISKVREYFLHSQ